MIKQQNSITSITKTMQRSISTISRELKCNTGKRGYRPKQANVCAYIRHKHKPKAINLTDTVKAYVVQKLELYWSPEQIVGHLELEENIKISAETAYRFVLQDHELG